MVNGSPCSWGEHSVESNERYYRRRATQEIAAARRAVTQSALERRRELAEHYLRLLSELTGVDETPALAELANFAPRDNRWSVAGSAEVAERSRNWIFA
jgi:hypothetical protein